MKSKILIQIVVLVTLLLIPITAFSTDWGCVTPGTWSRFFGIWGSSPTNIFVTSFCRFNFGTMSHENYGEILHFNGETWHGETLPTNPQPIFGIWGSSATNIFAVGNAGAILRYTGYGWSSMTSGTTNNLYGVWGSSANDVFAVGDAGTIRHYNGTSWSTSTSGTTNELRDVWGTAYNNVYAVGASGTILHYNGTSWHTDTSGTTNYLYGVWGSSASDVYAVGDAGTIRHYNGTSWGTSTSGTTNNLYGVWGTASNNVYAVGAGGIIRHYNGTSWHSDTNWTVQTLYRLWGTSATDVYAVGDWGAISHYPSYSITGSVKTSEASPVGDVQIWYYLYNAWTFVTTDGSGNYTVPNLGPGIYTIYPVKTGYTFSPSYLQVTISGASVSGKNFTAIPMPYSISGTVSGEIQAGVTMALSGSMSATTLTDASGNYTLRNLSNGSYTVTPDKAGYTFTPSNLPVTISGASASGKNFSATFTGGELGWVTMGSGTTNDLFGVWGSSATDVFAVGGNRTIIHTTDGGLN